MSLLEKIRKKPQDEKVRLIWIIAGICGILLLALWGLTSKVSRKLPKDTTLFQAIERGIKDVKDNYNK